MFDFLGDRLQTLTQHPDFRDALMSAGVRMMQTPAPGTNMLGQLGQGAAAAMASQQAARSGRAEAAQQAIENRIQQASLDARIAEADADNARLMAALGLQRDQFGLEQTRTAADMANDRERIAIARQEADTNAREARDPVSGRTMNAAQKADARAKAWENANSRMNLPEGVDELTPEMIETRYQEELRRMGVEPSEGVAVVPRGPGPQASASSATPPEYRADPAPPPGEQVAKAMQPPAAAQNRRIDQAFPVPGPSRATLPLSDLRTRMGSEDFDKRISAVNRALESSNPVERAKAVMAVDEMRRLVTDPQAVDNLLTRPVPPLMTAR